MKKRFLKLFTLLFLTTAIVFISQFSLPHVVNALGNTYYVAKTGNDRNAGTLASPWLTINHAASTAGAGDTVEVETGTYNEYVFDCYNSGTAGNPITFENYPGESPVIDGTGLNNLGTDYGLLYINANYVNWNGFTIQNSANYEGIYVISCSNVVISNIIIHNTYASAIKCQGSGGYIDINNCQIYNCNTGNQNETISIMPMNNVTIENCYLHNNPYDAIDIKDGSNNVTIINNEITSEGSGEVAIYIDCQGQTQNNIQIYDNKIHDFTGDGIILGSEGGGGDLTDTNIYNNLFYNLSGEAFQAQPYSFDKTVNVINNTFYGCNEGVDWDDTAASYQINCVTRNNIFDNPTGTGALIHYQYYSTGGVTIDHNLFYEPSGINAVSGTNYVKANPLLNNPPSDFSLQTGSPAIGAGFSVGAPSTDYAGTSRPQAAGYDIGAYEYIGSSPAPSPTGSYTSPVAKNDVYSTPENTMLSVPAPGILANDTDVNLNPLTAFKVTNPLHGTVTLNANGSFTYIPNTGYVGTDTFNYGANDGISDSLAATVTITVSATPPTESYTSPVAKNDVYSTPENTMLSVPAPGILANDTDVNLNPLTAFKVTNPLHGTVTLNANGSFTYIPNTGYVGTDTFNYGANDGISDSLAATVTITVSATPPTESYTSPVAKNDVYSTPENTMLSVPAPGILANDTDVNLNPLTAFKVTNPLHGTVTLNANGSFTYIPNSGYLGTDTFNYGVNDGTSDSLAATVIVIVSS